MSEIPLVRTEIGEITICEPLQEFSLRSGGRTYPFRIHYNYYGKFWVVTLKGVFTTKLMLVRDHLSLFQYLDVPRGSLTLVGEEKPDQYNFGDSVKLVYEEF